MENKYEKFQLNYYPKIYKRYCCLCNHQYAEEFSDYLPKLSYFQADAGKKEGFYLLTISTGLLLFHSCINIPPIFRIV